MNICYVINLGSSCINQFLFPPISKPSLCTCLSLILTNFAAYCSRFLKDFKCNVMWGRSIPGSHELGPEKFNFTLASLVSQVRAIPCEDESIIEAQKLCCCVAYINVALRSVRRDRLTMQIQATLPTLLLDQTWVSWKLSLWLLLESVP